MCVSETLESGVFLTCFLRCDSKEDGQLLQVYFWKTHPPLTETSLLPFNPYLVKPYWKSGLVFFFFFPLEVNLLILSINLLCLFNYSFLWSFEYVKRCLCPVSFNCRDQMLQLGSWSPFLSYSLLLRNKKSLPMYPDCICFLWLLQPWPQAGWLQQQKVALSQSWRPEGPHQGVCRGAHPPRF